MLVLPRIGTTTLNTSVDVVVETTGVGVFFLAHHSMVPPHGQAPAKLMVIVIVVLLLVQPVCTNDAVAVIVPGAHLDVNTPADTGELIKMTGAVQPTAPAAAALRSRARRSSVDCLGSARVSTDGEPIHGLGGHRRSVTIRDDP